MSDKCKKTLCNFNLSGKCITSIVPIKVKCMCEYDDDKKDNNKED